MKSWITYTIWTKIKIIMLILISIIFIIFAAQNWGKVNLKLIFWKFEVNLFSGLFFSFALGLLISFIFLRLKTQSLKGVIHSRNEEIKSLKYEIANKKDIKEINKKVDQLIEDSDSAGPKPINTEVEN